MSLSSRVRHRPSLLHSLLLSFASILLPAPESSGGLQTPPTARTSLTGLPTLVRAYDAILDARFADAARETTTCRDVPPVACAVLDATRLWWRIQLDPYSRARDAEFLESAERTIAAAESWTKREPARAEAWFYLGSAYGARVQWRVLRTERLAAARDGQRIKESLETALRLDPKLEDANFGIGLYQYYADIAPAVAKAFRWLLRLPGGNKIEGLDRMLKARERGQLVRGEADYQLHIIYLWYERDFPRALDLARGLAARYPGNPLFLQVIAEVHDIYFHDPTSSARAYERLLEAARLRRINEAALAEVVARLGLARQLDALFESDRALEHARTVIAIRPPAPHGALAEAWLGAGRALLHLGQVREAQDAFRRALAAMPPDDAIGLRERVRAAGRERVDPVAAEAYRLSLIGWRAFERKSFGEAEAYLAKALAMRPADMVARYRYARVAQAQGKPEAARKQLDMVAGAGATTPAVVFAEACVALAALIEDANPMRALTLYQQAAQTFGAFADTRVVARRGAARLRQALKADADEAASDAP